MNPNTIQSNLTKVIEKVDGVDIVVEAFINEAGKVVKQTSFTKDQVTNLKAQSQKKYDDDMDRFDALLAVFA